MNGVRSLNSDGMRVVSTVSVGDTNGDRGFSIATPFTLRHSYQSNVRRIQTRMCFFDALHGNSPRVTVNWHAIGWREDFTIRIKKLKPVSHLSRNVEHGNALIQKMAHIVSTIIGNTLGSSRIMHFNGTNGIHPNSASFGNNIHKPVRHKDRFRSVEETQNGKRLLRDPLYHKAARKDDT